MDLSFTRFDADAEPIAMPHDLAVLMVGIAARQAASRTAAAQAGCSRPVPDPRLFEPENGAFNGATAEAIAGWREEGREEARNDEAGVYPEVSADLQGGIARETSEGNEDGAQAPREV